MKSPAAIILLAIILATIIATVTASIDNRLVVGNVENALQPRSNLRVLQHGKGEDVQEEDDEEVRTWLTFCQLKIQLHRCTDIIIVHTVYVTGRRGRGCDL